MSDFLLFLAVAVSLAGLWAVYFAAAKQRREAGMVFDDLVGRLRAEAQARERAEREVALLQAQLEQVQTKSQS